ncbi:MAG: hypothetical protein JNK72_12145 [Myxococcales bacterium]|nr:hypothetical protein [Myxococcales bacterium]
MHAWSRRWATLWVIGICVSGCGEDATDTSDASRDDVAVDAALADILVVDAVVSDRGAAEDRADGSDVAPLTDQLMVDAADAGDADARDAGDADAGDADAGDADAGAISLDLGLAPDVAVDAGPRDTGNDVGFDAGPRDVGFDAGPRDVGFDTGPRDTSNDVGFDTGPRDVGFDTGPRDTGNDVGFDTGPRDTGNDVGFDTGPRDTGNDVGFDTGPRDTGNDVGFDAGPRDTGNDVGFDAGPRDTGNDVGFDTGPRDTGNDVGFDTGPRDTGNDVGFDTGPRDTGNDVGFDTGPRDTGNDVQAPSDPVMYSGTFPNRGGRFTANLTVLGERRSMVLAVPSTPQPNPALLILFHGTNGDGNVIMTEANAAALASTDNVIVVAPTSRWLPFGDFDHVDAETYWETAPNTDPDRNQDLVLTRAIIAEARRAYGVDPQRVYAAGHSNGAFMAHFVAQLFRDRIAAYASSSGGIVNCPRTTTCRFQGAGTTCAQLRTRSGYCACTGPDLPTAVGLTGNRPAAYITHGTRDPLVSVYYSCILEDRLTARGSTFQTVLRDGDGHVVPTNFAQSAWAFLRTRQLGMP